MVGATASCSARRKPGSARVRRNRKVNRPGCRGRLLTVRGCKAWGSCPPPSASALVGKLEKPSASEAEVCGFDSHPGHQMLSQGKATGNATLRDARGTEEETHAGVAQRQSGRFPPSVSIRSIRIVRTRIRGCSSVGRAGGRHPPCAGSIPAGRPEYRPARSVPCQPAKLVKWVQFPPGRPEGSSVVERGCEEARRGGSIPPLPASFSGVAQWQSPAL